MNWILLSPPPLSFDPDTPKIWNVHRYAKCLGRIVCHFRKCSSLEAKNVAHFKVCHKGDKRSNYNL